MSRRERQVAWALGRRQRQVASHLVWNQFRGMVWFAAPVDRSVGEAQRGQLRRRPFTVVAVDGFLVASRVRRGGYGTLSQWAATMVTVAEVGSGPLSVELAALERATPKREADEVADWVITRPVADAIKAGYLRA